MHRDILFGYPMHWLGTTQTPDRTLLRQVEHAEGVAFRSLQSLDFLHVRAERERRVLRCSKLRWRRCFYIAVIMSILRLDQAACCSSKCPSKYRICIAAASARVALLLDASKPPPSQERWFLSTKTRAAKHCRSYGLSCRAQLSLRRSKG